MWRKRSDWSWHKSVFGELFSYFRRRSLHFCGNVFLA